MVAAAGMSDAMIVRHVWLWPAALDRSCSLLVAAGLYQRVLLINRVPMPKPPDSSRRPRAGGAGTLGYSAPSRDSASGFDDLHSTISNYIDATSTATRSLEQAVHTIGPSRLCFWYRTSPRPLIPWGNENNLTGTIRRSTSAA